jgi:hypothetical protein
MEVSLPGVIGAAVGLYVGWLDWKILKGILQAAETKNRTSWRRRGLSLPDTGHRLVRADFWNSGDRLPDHRLLGRQPAGWLR